LPAFRSPQVKKIFQFLLSDFELQEGEWDFSVENSQFQIIQDSEDEEEETDEMDEDLKLALKLHREELRAQKRLLEQQKRDELLAKKLQKGDFQATPGLITPGHPEKVEDSNRLSIKKGDSALSDPTDDGTCVVCMHLERNAVFVPCAHRCCCVKCAKEIHRVKRFCPLCWTNLEGIIECTPFK